MRKQFLKGLKLERKEVKAMCKKLTVFIGVFFAFMLMTGVSASGFVMESGDYRFTFDNYDVFDDPISVLPDFPDQADSGNTWGIVDLLSYQKRDPVTGVWQTEWVRGEGGKYYTAVVGGLTLETSITNPTGYNVVPDPTTFPHNSYFMNDTVNNTGPGYLKLYEHNSDTWVADVGAGPNMAGLCAFSTFGGAITTGTLVIDAVFNSLALASSGDLNATPGVTLFRATSNTSTQALLIGWCDVVGGTWRTLIDTNKLYGGSDLRFSVDLRYLYDAPTNQWSPVSGWPTYSVGQLEGTAEEDIEEGDCRVTAGGNKDGATVACVLMRNGKPDPETCALDIAHTWGGQAGAQPGTDGNWTHHYKESNQVSFLFHSNDLFCIECSDPGDFCFPARPAPYRQIDFVGLGQFNNMKGFNFPEGDLCFEVHLEDIGEPGQGGKWPISGSDCVHCPGTPIVNGDPDDPNNRSDCRDCTDYYEIKIYDSAEHGDCGCTGDVLWVNGSKDEVRCGSGDPELEGFFTRAGNVQMHPQNN